MTGKNGPNRSHRCKEMNSMKTGRWIVVAVTLVLVCLSGLSEAASPKKSRSYVVIRVKDMAGETSYDVIAMKEIRQRSAEAQKEYKQAVLDWNKARVEARKNKEKFTEKKPLKPVIVKVGPVFRTEEKAETYAQKLRDRQEAREARNKKPSDAEDNDDADGDDKGEDDDNDDDAADDEGAE